MFIILFVIVMYQHSNRSLSQCSKNTYEVKELKGRNKNYLQTIYLYE